MGVSRAGTALVVVALVLVAGAAPAWAGTANGGLGKARGGNPLAGVRWGVYEGPIDGVWPAYAGAHGGNKRLLGKIALRPRAVWDGYWNGNPKATAQESISDSTQGDPNVLTQVAIFRLDPWESCSASWSKANQASYRAWIRAYAAGIGSARVALILQPDMPFAVCVSSESRNSSFPTRRRSSTRCLTPPSTSTRVATPGISRRSWHGCSSSDQPPERPAAVDENRCASRSSSGRA